MTHTGAKERVTETSHQKVRKVDINEVILKYCSSKIVNPDPHPVKTPFKNEITNRHIVYEMVRNVPQVERKCQIETCIYKKSFKINQNECKFKTSFFPNIISLSDG